MVRNTEEALQYLRPLFAGKDRELLVALCLGGNLRVRRCIRVPGNEVSCPAPVRRILNGAMQVRAPSLLLAHNHPSEDHRPSEADQVMTRQISRACRDIGIRLVDHIIIGGERYSSFRQLGIM
ncbi:JAB domain-containing protein [Sphingomonas sp. DG1-23]|uniref:JAB domain-containing protein n=1 Tax=Sphingomonas sp. DG1-23 TaxID=3068316 RepID=UPI00353060CD